MASSPSEADNLPILRLRQPAELLAASTTPPRIRHAPGVLTWTPPADSRPLVASVTASSASCFIWVHLQASICTEWEHTSMILTPNSQVGARVATTTTGPPATSVSSLLQALERNDKRPKTIHRCILQRMASKEGCHSNGALACHVCDASYPNYKCYMEHLLDATCAQLKASNESKPDIQIEAEVINGRKRVLGQDDTAIKDSKRSRAAANSRPINLSLRCDNDDAGTEDRRDQAEEEERQPLDDDDEDEDDNDDDDDNNEGKAMASQSLLLLSSDNQGRAEAALTSLCPHFAAATQTSPVSLNEFVADQAILATLKVQLTTLLVGLLGEDRLTALGYPDKDILPVLNSVLEMACCRWLEPTEGCTSVCPRLEVILAPNQVKFRLLKCQVKVARANIGQLLEICVPDKRLWAQNKWNDKPIEVILSEIISEQNNLSCLQSGGRLLPVMSTAVRM